MSNQNYLCCDTMTNHFQVISGSVVVTPVEEVVVVVTPVEEEVVVMVGTCMMMGKTGMKTDF